MRRQKFCRPDLLVTIQLTIARRELLRHRQLSGRTRFEIWDYHAESSSGELQPEELAAPQDSCASKIGLLAIRPHGLAESESMRSYTAHFRRW